MTRCPPRNCIPSSRDPLRFVRMVEAEKRRQAARGLTVTSVSKTSERLLEAPATVVVVTADDIARRGYIDLEQLLHDLPGFDISRGSGVVYSNFYQRGYRSNGNDRTLFLIDGVEDNDLWSNIAYVSRQYPLSNIDRVEVVYGPASTMYGANAFVGVINVITKDAASLLGESRHTALEADGGFGVWNTRWVDTTFAASNRADSVSLLLTARVYTSDERDLSGFPEWDYNPAFYDTIDYKRVLRVGPGSTGGLPTPEQSPLVERTADGGLTVSDLGAELARQLDKRALGLLVGGKPLRFTDRTDDWSVYAKLRVKNALFGFATWRAEEGFNSWYTDDFYAGADNGVLWIPRQSFVYLKVDTELSERMRLGLFSQYKWHSLDDGTMDQQLRDYASGRLHLADLVNPAGPVASFWRTTRYDEASEQFRAEATLAWDVAREVDLVAGTEVRQGAIQGDYVLRVFRDDDPSVVFRDDVANHTLAVYDQLDLGLFAQATWRPRPDLKLVAGGRVDDDSQRGRTDPDAKGYGTVFSPRLAAVWSPGAWVLKAVYAEAFKDASNFNRYATSPGLRDLTNPDLKPERVKNVELSAAWQASEHLFVDLAAYRATYSNAVATRRVPYQGGTTLQNESLGSLEIRGLQATARWKWSDLEVWGNYTYADPVNTNPLDSNGQPRVGPDGEPLSRVPVGDIATNQLKLGADWVVRERLTLDLHADWVGARKTGASTSVFTNPLDQIDPYVVVNAAVSYRDLLPNLTLQLVVDNLLDAAYEDPGVRAADGLTFAARLPQNDRAVFLRLVWGF